MGGQDGYQRDMLVQNTDSETVVAGIRITPSERFNLGVSVAQTESEQRMDPFDLSAPDYVETHPPMSFDVSNSHLYSVTDISRFDVNADASIKFNGGFWWTFYYRYADFEDNNTMFKDYTGNVQILGTYLGWSF